MLRIQLIRFFFVGILNTLFGYSLYAFFIYKGIPYYFAIILTTILGLLFNFKTISGLVFNSKEKGIFIKFCLLYSTLALLNIILINILSQHIANYYFTGLFAIVICSSLSFIINRKLMYKPKEMKS